MKRQKVFMILMVAIIGMNLLFTACSSASRLDGQWVSESEYSDFEAMTLYSDGTGIADGVSISWQVDETTGELIISHIFGTDEYTYSISGDTLYLDEDTYNRVD